MPRGSKFPLVPGYLKYAAIDILSDDKVFSSILVDEQIQFATRSTHSCGLAPNKAQVLRK
jgi:hypothetical protein